MEINLNFQYSDRGLEFLWKWKMSFNYKTYSDFSKFYICCLVKLLQSSVYHMEKFFYPSHYCFLGSQPSFVVRLLHIWRVYMASQVYPLTPSYGSNWGHKIADFLVCLTLASSLSTACFSFQKPFSTLYYKASDLLGFF